MKPLLKWLGGKTQILDKILITFPRIIRNYYEPFVGGGAILIGLLESSIRVTGTVYAGDINEKLIAFYNNIQQHPNLFIDELFILKQQFAECDHKDKNITKRNPATLEDAKYSKESYYYWVRKQYNALNVQQHKSIKASAMLLFLNKTCFRGLYREGPNGFNAPYGNNKNPTIGTRESILTMSHLLRDVVFIHSSFDDLLEHAIIETSNFIYMDPPYFPEKKDSFVSYTANGFTLDQHKKLSTICETMKQNNIGFTLSNANTQFVREMFPYNLIIFFLLPSVTSTPILTSFLASI